MEKITKIYGMDDLNVILPVHNEKLTIESVLKEWKSNLDKFNIKYHFIICEDGSTDGTKSLLIKIKEKYRLILNQKDERRGYGKAVISGIEQSHSKYILCIDSDGQCSPEDFGIFWKIKHQDSILIGWRTNRKDPFYRKIYSGSFKIIFNLLFPNSIHDPSAPYVLFRKSTISPFLKDLTYLKEGFWWGFIGMCHKRKIIVCEQAICHRKRTKGNTVVYQWNKIPGIVCRNILGLIRLYLAV